MIRAKMAASASNASNTEYNTTDSTKNKTLSSSAVYHSQSSVWGKLNKIYGVFTTLVVVVSIILCAVEGSKAHRKPTDYLLLANIICTSFVAVVQIWWYRRSHLAEDKVWFLLLIYTVLLLQCITTVIYLFVKVDAPSITTTHAPGTTHHHTNRTTPHHHTKIHWIPVHNSSTIKPGSL